MIKVFDTEVGKVITLLGVFMDPDYTLWVQYGFAMDGVNLTDTWDGDYTQVELADNLVLVV